MESEQRPSTAEQTESKPDLVARTLQEVWHLASPVCEAEGMELVHVEFQREPGGRILRLYIDKPGGIQLNDCVAISRQVSDLLDVSVDIRGPYHLEVTSPGTNRPLGRAADFDRFKGSRVKIRTVKPLDGRSNYTGTLLGMEENRVLVMVDTVTFAIPLADIAKARLVGEHGEKT